MKKTLKTIGKVLLALIGFILIYALCTYLLPKITISKEADTKQDYTIYIITNGVHTDVVVPTKTKEIDWSKEVKYTNAKSLDSASEYLAMGWGDKGFYLETPNWSDLKASVAFKAAFALSTTAIHATYHSKMVESKTCRKILISRDQYLRLIKYIQDSFKKDANNHFINIKTNANYSNSDAFYEANGKYNIFKTCNTWANDALKACGQKCCFWTPFDKGIFEKYE
ncbi:TIGR02117 family protein [Pedobacter fastidiosus]|uniref:TIGR02117 family protein n=1 Tax=Pedobacter fastidiosus TaxID=2765361 RepID=A0ABR7KM92_9SPHI|nr:TIGR02117 family protein [Pedobacter fastidiosus]MBC6109196.1 TIGR02117 family protein [Pedobacter fastidiosus]